MKLFAKYNRVNITATIITFLVGSIAFYFVLTYILTRQLDRGLRMEQQELLNYVQEHDSLPETENTKHQWTEIRPATEEVKKEKPKTARSYNKIENENEAVRQIRFTARSKGRLYEVTVNLSETETEDLLKLIILVTLGMIAVIVLSNFIINRKLLAGLWKPFYRTIDSIRDYELATRQPLRLNRENIDELDLLNESLNKMTGRIYQDYLALKTFTENASHEMQTPLAVIRSKVESLLQESEGKEKTVQQLLSIEDATLKLSKLHQSLLLLTKLENRQFMPDEAVNLTAIIRNKLAEREEFIASKKLTVNITTEEVVLPFHQHLAEILVNNLLNNMIRYTPENGIIGIDLTGHTLSVSNTAANGSLDKEKIFQRFYKTEQSAESTGLGLAIVKEICLLAGFTISYQYTDHTHQFIIHFSV
jgi:signal transduction histidine kinase